MASYYLKAAASYLDRSNISSSYTSVPNPTTQTPLSTNTNTNQSTTQTTNSTTNSNWSPPSQVGLWIVHRATHNSTNKLVSIWTAEKKLDSSSSSFSSLPALVNVANGWANSASNNPNNDNNLPKTPLEKVIHVLKKEVSSLSRLRHPCILEVVEPLEETRTSMVFATEPITGSLIDYLDQSASHRNSRSNSNSNYSSSRHSTSRPELDEVETQKGLLQIGKGLQFLHESAKLVHCNLTPEAIIINAKGDWKISGFGLSTYLKQADGTETRWEFPEYNANLPDSIQRNFDYVAPEYCLDEHLSTSNDMYSLGCILHYIHTRNGPPFYNHRSLDRMRKNIENLAVLRAAWNRVPDDVQEVLSQLVTRSPTTRLSATNFLASRYFSSNILVSTLAFLDRDTFNSKQNEEHVQFMKGLLRILPQFSHKVLKQKILPSLIEECRKLVLLPFLLPNIFFIAQLMDPEEFRTDLLPQLKPLFTIKDPPQNILILLDNLEVLQNKATPQVFREDVMPLIYVALESDVPALQEKALKVVPPLCESLEYTHVKQVLFPKVTMVFSKTTLLSVKVNTLICFHSIVKILDKYTLTEKLVPLLARIKTKEPAVMIATLAVHEEMGKKVELNAIATLILPQLWTMSIGPLLNIDQFNRFMNSIQLLSSRVRQEHTKHLIEAKRLEDTTNTNTTTCSNASLAPPYVPNEANDFENLVKGSSWTSSTRACIQEDTAPSIAPTSPSNNHWGFDDPLGDFHNSASSSSFNNNTYTTRPISNPNPPSNISSAPSFVNTSTFKSHSFTLAPPPLPSSSSPFPSSNNMSNYPTLQTQLSQTNNHNGDKNILHHSQFQGLPTLLPQPSSLNDLLSSSSSSSSSMKTTTTNNPGWNRVPALHSPSNPPHLHLNPKNNLSSKAALADFDPFA